MPAPVSVSDAATTQDVASLKTLVKQLQTDLGNKASLDDLQRMLNDRALKSDVSKELSSFEKTIIEIKRLAITTEGQAQKLDRECQQLNTYLRNM